MSTLSGAVLLVQCLEAQGVEYVFGIPGAKIDAVFNALKDSSINVILCRHEQNAAFMASAYGRLTGKPGVVLVTSGPGVGNLVTGLLTATTEGDPVVAIGGNVPQNMSLRESHQGTDNVKLLETATKSSVEVHQVDNIPEVIANAFRLAVRARRGACFISLPQDVLFSDSEQPPIASSSLEYGAAPEKLILKAADLLNGAKNPVILLGLEASRPENAKAIRALLKKHPLAVIGTYQAAGAISKDLVQNFIGRVGLFKNQPGDLVLDKADVVLTIGFHSIEYDPEIWNVSKDKNIIHLDYNPCNIHNTYQPACELLGDIAANIMALSAHLLKKERPIDKPIQVAREQLLSTINSGKHHQGVPIHPLRFIYELGQAVDEHTTICCDIGSVYMWMARYFFSYHPHHLLFSNGQQTLGVALPWAMAACYVRKNEKILSISGDGGFLFSAMELETAVREQLHLVHFIWRDGAYNMVLEQELMKYHRTSSVTFGSLDIVQFAQAFGAIGLELKHPDDFQALFIEAMRAKKPVLIDVPIDYHDNPALFKATNPHQGH